MPSTPLTQQFALSCRRTILAEPPIEVRRWEGGRGVSTGIHDWHGDWAPGRGSLSQARPINKTHAQPAAPHHTPTATHTHPTHTKQLKVLRFKDWATLGRCPAQGMPGICLFYEVKALQAYGIIIIRYGHSVCRWKAVGGEVVGKKERITNWTRVKLVLKLLLNMRAIKTNCSSIETLLLSV